MDIINEIQSLEIDSSVDFDYNKSFSSSNKPIAIKGIKNEILYMNESAKILSNSSDETIFVSYDQKLSEDVKRINELSHIAINKTISVKTENGIFPPFLFPSKRFPRTDFLKTYRLFHRKLCRP